MGDLLGNDIPGNNTRSHMTMHDNSVLESRGMNSSKAKGINETLGNSLISDWKKTSAIYKLLLGNDALRVEAVPCNASQYVRQDI